MPFFRRNRLRPITTEKHEVTWSNLAQDAGTATIVVPLAIGTASADTDNSQEVVIGKHVNWMYFEFHFSAEAITSTKVIHWQVIANPHGDTTHTGNSYNTEAKNQVLKRGMEMLPKDVSTVFKRIFVVRIPRGVARMATGNKIDFIYQCSSTQTINACGFVIYKAVK